MLTFEKILFEDLMKCVDVSEKQLDELIADANKKKLNEKVIADLETKGKKAQYINMRDFTDENKEIIVRAK